MSKYVVVCCKYYSLGVGWRDSKVELDKQKNNLLLTPVIYDIIEWTVKTVKLLNNVVVGTGQANA